MELSDNGKPGENRGRKATKLKRNELRHAGRVAERLSSGKQMPDNSMPGASLQTSDQSEAPNSVTPDIDQGRSAVHPITQPPPGTKGWRWMVREILWSPQTRSIIGALGTVLATQCG